MSDGPARDGTGRASRLAERVSVAVYHALVRTRYPSDLRTRYGRDMVEDFRALMRESVRRGGLRGVVRTWVRVSRDLVRVGPEPLSGGVGRRGSRNVRGTGGGGRWTSGWWGGTREDVRFAVRSLAREPRFAGSLVAVLAVGIAMNVAVFSVVNAYLLRPLPYPHGERLVEVNTWGTVSWMEVDEIFELAVSWDLDVFTIVGEGKPELVPGAWITPDFLEAYDVHAVVGRTLTASDAEPVSGSVAMISHRLWRERFGGDPEVVGRTFRAFMSDRPEEAELFTIVGVLPSDFWYVNDYTDVLVPIREERAVYTGRLRPGIGPEEAESFLARVSEGRIHDAPPGFRVSVRSLRDRYVSAVRPTLLVLQTAALLVLLIACANAGVLLLVRAIRRERELSVRQALGAGRGRLGRQLLAEGLLVAGMAGTLGAAGAALALSAARGLVTARLGRSAPGGMEGLTVDGTVLVATLAVTALVGIFFGIVPLLTSRGGHMAATLRAASRGGGDSRARSRARNAMVVAELALSLALLTGAGLMVRSALDLQTRDLGFEPEGVVRGEVGLREASYATPAARHALFDRLVGEVRVLPGVAAAGLTTVGAFTSDFQARAVEGEGAAAPADAVSSLVGEGVFSTLGIEVVRGRDFDASDVEGSEPVAIVSESLAAALWPGLDPIGRGVRPAPRAWATAPPDPGPFRRIVGVVVDIQRGFGVADAGDLYEPYRHGSPLWMNLLVRSEPGAPSPVPAIEGVLADLDPEIPLYGVVDLERAVEAAAAPTRFVAALLSGFSAFALLLATVGLYGVIAYSVRQRRRDVAIRVALGADRGSVVRLFLASGLGVALIGVALGTLGGSWLGRALESQLHGVTPGDPLTRVTLAAALLVTALVAVWLPARGAARAEPTGVLREE